MPEDGGLIGQALIGLKPVNAWVHTYTKPRTSSTRSRGLGWRIHESVEDTKLSTHKQHSLSVSSSFPIKFCSFVVSGYQDINKNCTVQCSGLSWSSTPFSACTNANRLGKPTFIQGQFVFIRGVDLGYVSNSATYLILYEISITAVQMSCVACPANSGSPFSSTSKMISSCIRIIPESTMRQ